MSIYGPLISDTQIEKQLLQQLASWLPSYIVEAARQDGLTEIALPRSYDTTRDAQTKWTEQAMPAIIVQIGGTVQLRRLGSMYRATWGATVGAVVGGQSRANTRQLAGIYALAIAACLTQQCAWTAGLEWTDTDYSLIDEDRSRTLMAAIVSFDVSMDNVLDVALGPFGPPPDPGIFIPGLPDYGNAVTVDTQSTLTPIGDEFP